MCTQTQIHTNTNQTRSVSPYQRQIQVLVQSQNKIHRACSFTVAFCFVSIHTYLAFTTNNPLLPMWLLYSQLAQLCATHQQMGAFQSCQVSCCLLPIHQAKHYFFLSLTEDQLETFNAARTAVTPCEQMCSVCK